MKFNGPDYIPLEDNSRLEKQHERIRNLMIDGQWRTLSEIATHTKDPQASISAQLRHLRKPRFGRFKIEKRSRGERKKGLFEYRLMPPNEFEIQQKMDFTEKCLTCGRRK